LCTHWPNSGYLPGANITRTPRFCGVQVRPPSSVRYTPPAEMPHTCAGYLRGRAKWCAAPARHYPAPSGAGADDRRVHAPTTKFRLRPEFEKAPPVLHRNKVRWVPPAGPGIFARCFSAKRRCQREIEFSLPADWSSSFQNRRTNAAAFPSNSGLTPICAQGVQRLALH